MSQFDPDHLTILINDFPRAVAGYDMKLLLPRITAPVLLVQCDPACGGALSDAEVASALKLLPYAGHAKLTGTGHSFHDPANMPAIVAAVLPFLASVSR